MKEKNTGRNYQWETRQLNWNSTESIALALEQLNELLNLDHFFTFKFDGEGHYTLFAGDEEVIMIKGFKHFVDAIKLFSYSVIAMKMLDVGTFSTSR